MIHDNLLVYCKCLEEPILSTLWETQWSLCTLLRVLPEATWEFEDPGFGKHVFEVVGDPSPEDWNRVRRYASWMRRVRLEEWTPLGEETFNKLHLNLPSDGWFPALQALYWCITESNLPHADMFFSPHLKKISIHAALEWGNTEVPPGILPTLASTISALPTSSLERIKIGGGHITMPWAYLKNSMSSVVLSCGASLTEYNSPVLLSGAAANHLIQLPHLRTLRIHGPPPGHSTASLSLSFPPLEQLTLGDSAAHGWILLLSHLEGRPSITQAVTPLSNARESLKSLIIDDLSSIIIDASFVSPIQVFRNLVDLNVESYCHDEDDQGECTFKLNNDNVIELATALTQLKSLFLGNPCFENTCSTTVACLLPISVRCVKLEKLEVHFNTTNIVDDFEDVLEDPQFQHLRSLQRCPLDTLYVFRTPLTLDEPGFETVVKGMIDIFPSLVEFEGDVTEPTWDELSERIADIRKE